MIGPAARFGLGSFCPGRSVLAGCGRLVRAAPPPDHGRDLVDAGRRGALILNPVVGVTQRQDTHVFDASGLGSVSASPVQGVRKGVAQVAATDFTRTNVGLQADAPHQSRDCSGTIVVRGPRASRDACGSRVEGMRDDVVRTPLGSFGREPGRVGRGRIGVVKLLRARGGCLGVIRWRAWEAAKSPGELPNEHRSRNTRWRPGELKHLSTRRKRNQPRLPQ